MDNLINSCDKLLSNVAEIIDQEIPFIKANVRDAATTDKIFKENHFDASILFTNLKAVDKSISMPLEYYETT